MQVIHAISDKAWGAWMVGTAFAGLLGWSTYVLHHHATGSSRRTKFMQRRVRPPSATFVKCGIEHKLDIAEIARHGAVVLRRCVWQSQRWGQVE